MKSPIEMLYVIVSHKNLKKVNTIFSEYGISHYSILMGKGTAQSKLGDIFGFGIIDRDVIVAVINKTDSTQLLSALDDTLKLSVPHHGVAFTTEISAITSDVIDLLNLNLEEKK